MVRISQLYGNISNNAWYLANGINTPFHNGVDLVLGLFDPAKTYGSECIACFDGNIVKTNWNNPMSNKGNGLTLQSKVIEEDGVKRIYQAVYWHLSEIIKTSGEVKKGDVIGYTGNSGNVFPFPTQSAVFNGAHLHFMLFVFQWSNIKENWTLLDFDNGVNGAVNPVPYIDDLQGEEGIDPGILKDLPPIQYFFGDLWDKIKKALGYE